MQMDEIEVGKDYERHERHGTHETQSRVHVLDVRVPVGKSGRRTGVKVLRVRQDGTSYGAPMVITPRSLFRSWDEVVMDLAAQRDLAAFGDQLSELLGGEVTTGGPKYPSRYPGKNLVLPGSLSSRCSGF